jgi:alpha/beta hydrolase family protein
MKLGYLLSPAPGGVIAAALVASTLTGCWGDGSSGQVAPPPPPPPQGIVKIVINTATSQAVTFGGTSFGSVGQYTKIRGTAFGQLNPNDPKNAVITDIGLAPRDANGLVDYSMDFYILAPVNLANGNHKIFYEVNNRGGKQFGGFNESGGGNNPTTAADAGGAFLMNQGYTMVWSGWDGEVSSNTNADILHINLPVAQNADGSAITGPSYEYIVNDNATTTSFTTYYNTATTDTTKATLTMRNHLTDTPVTIPSTGWSWTSPNTIALAGNAPFNQSWIYELYFTAQQPYVAGIGMAAVRDFVSFLRYQKADQLGTPNPLAGDPQRVIWWSLSQPSRLMNDYVWLGMNQDTSGNKVFDGGFSWIGAGNGLGINYRFAQNGRTERNRQNHLNVEAVFPFSFVTTTDPLTGKTDGRLVRCTATSTCPLIMNVFSGNEIWVKAGSSLYTDPSTGMNLADAPNVRNYYISGSQHGGASAPNTVQGATVFGVCGQFGSGVEPNPVERALFTDLDQWISGTPPPPSAVPSVGGGTAVFAQTGAFSPIGIGVVPQAAIGYPTIPNVLYSGLVTVRNLWNFGSGFPEGILNPYPGTPTGKYYPNSVPTVDADGNDIAGIRLPEVVAPVATNSGWGLRALSFGGSTNGTDGCESTGQSIVFAPTQAARMALGDPRLSLTERYTNHAGLVAARTAAANALMAQRLLLQADVNAYIAAAANPITVVASPTYGNYTW